jgi:RNA polymerase sigma factor (sigma-70 family)
MGEYELEKAAVEAQGGSEDALAELCGWFAEQKQFFSRAYRILRDWEDTYDVIQDSAEKICSDIARYDPKKGDFSNWCYTIVTNAAIDELRKRELRRRFREKEGFSNLEPIRPLPPPDEGLADILDEAEEKADLSVRQKLIWRLYRSGDDVSSIAMIVMEDTSDSAKATVSRDIWRAKRKIELYLWKCYPDLAELYANVMLLFSIELRCQDDLDNGKIPRELRQEFENRKITSLGKVIIPNNKKGIMWLITDKDRPVYLVCKEKDRLNIYN